MRGDRQETLCRIFGSGLAGGDGFLCSSGVGSEMDCKIVTFGGQGEGDASAKTAAGSGNKNDGSAHS